ncbi:HdeD family acid-resistance protein [Streptomyces sp. SA3_actF]|uniref:HdeD family acid-resistance protein n=1 Tax=Streptomyces sp. SA3_actF TaxID=682181 RepID=UPI001F1E82E5|nr:HdeD family acid-resistance protein [Streptomyces sp. SA3_actF]
MPCRPARGPDGTSCPIPLRRLARAAWWVVLLAGLASVLLGVLVLVWPGSSLRVAGVLFGVYLLVSGVVQLVAATGTHTAAGMRVLGFVSGALSVLLGLFCFRGATQSVLLLALWIGIGWLFRGLTQVVAALAEPASPARGWQLVLGVLAALAGVVLVVSPFASAWALILVAGIWLLAVGVTEIATALRLRHRLRLD